MSQAHRWRPRNGHGEYEVTVLTWSIQFAPRHLWIEQLPIATAMKVQHEHRHLGFEFDWLAVDENGLCFFISTAGFGWIPDSVTAPSYPSETLSLVLGLPVRSEAIVHRDPGTSTEWSEAAKRGFYAIDWNHSTDSYTLAAEPEVPILSPQLPVELLRIVGMARVALNRTDGSVTMQHH